MPRIRWPRRPISRVARKKVAAVRMCTRRAQRTILLVHTRRVGLVGNPTYLAQARAWLELGGRHSRAAKTCLLAANAAANPAKRRRERLAADDGNQLRLIMSSSISRTTRSCGSLIFLIRYSNSPLRSGNCLTILYAPPAMFRAIAGESSIGLADFKHVFRHDALRASS